MASNGHPLRQDIPLADGWSHRGPPDEALLRMSYDRRKDEDADVAAEAEVDEGTVVLFTVDEFAQVLRCSPRTVRRRIREGTIRKMAGLGRLIRIHPSEIGRLARTNPSALFK
jgi:excisionase family DNA binding protein